MFKKFLVALLVVGGIFSVGNFANAAENIDGKLNYQQLYLKPWIPQNILW